MDRHARTESDKEVAGSAGPSLPGVVRQSMTDAEAKLVRLEIFTGCKPDGPASFIPKVIGELVLEICKDRRLTVEEHG